MFKRLIYKLHLGELLTPIKGRIPAEIFNLILFIVLIISMSSFFAFKGISSAQTNSSSTSCYGDATNWINPILIGTDCLVKLYSEGTTNFNPAVNDAANSNKFLTLPDLSLVKDTGTSASDFLITGWGNLAGDGTVCDSREGNRDTRRPQFAVGNQNGMLNTQTGDINNIDCAGQGFHVASSATGTTILTVGLRGGSQGWQTKVYKGKIDSTGKLTIEGLAVTIEGMFEPKPYYSTADNKFYIIGKYPDPNARVRGVVLNGESVLQEKQFESNISTSANASTAFCTNAKSEMFILYNNRVGGGQTATVQKGSTTTGTFEAPVNFDNAFNSEIDSGEFINKPSMGCAQDSGYVYAFYNSSKSGPVMFTYDGTAWSKNIFHFNTIIKDSVSNVVEDNYINGTVSPKDGAVFVAVSYVGNVYALISQDNGKTFTDPAASKVASWPNGPIGNNGSLILKVDSANTGHLLITFDSNAGSTNGKSRKNFYTRKANFYTPAAVKTLAVTCQLISKVTYNPDDVNKDAQTTFTDINLPNSPTTPFNLKLTQTTTDPALYNSSPSADIIPGGKLSIKNFTAPQDRSLIYKIVVAPTSPCRLDTVVSYLSTYATQQGTTLEELTKDSAKLNAAIVLYHLANYKIHASDYLIHPSAGGENRNVGNNVFSLLLDNKINISEIAAAAAKNLAANGSSASTVSVPQNNLVGFANAATKVGDLILRNAGVSFMGLSNIAGTAVSSVLSSPQDVKISVDKPDTISQQGTFSGSNNDPVAVNRDISIGSTGQNELSSYFASYVQPLITNDKANYPLIPFRIESSDNYVISLNNIEGFASSNAALDYALSKLENLPDGQAKTQQAILNVKRFGYDRTGPIQSYLRSQKYGDDVINNCARMYFDSNTKCPELLIKKDLAPNQDDSQLVLSNLGFPGSDLKNAIEKANLLSTLPSELGINGFSKANRFEFSGSFIPDMNATNCNGLCVNKIANTPLTLKIKCDACRMTVDDKFSIEGAIGARTNMTSGSGADGVPIVKELYNYAQLNDVYNGQTISLSRNLQSTSNISKMFSQYTSLYNQYPHTNLEMSKDLIPLNSIISAKFNTTSTAPELTLSDYRPSYTANSDANGNLLVSSSVDDTKTYGVVAIKDNRADQTKASPDTFAVFKTSSNTAPQVTVNNTKALDLSKIISSRDDLKNKGYSFKTDQNPQIASVLTNSAACSYDELRILAPTNYKVSGPGNIGTIFSNIVNGVVKYPYLYFTFSGATDGSIGDRTGASCSDFITNNIENTNAWNMPVLVPYNTKMTTNNDSSITTSANKNTTVLSSLTNPNELRIYLSANSASTQFPNFWTRNSNVPLPLLTPDTLVNDNDGSHYQTLKLADALGSDKNITYSTSLSVNGILTIVASAENNNIVIYRWNLDNFGTIPTPVSKYNIQKFLDQSISAGTYNWGKPDSIKITASDTNPTNFDRFTYAVEATYKAKDSINNNTNRSFSYIFDVNDSDTVVYSNNPEALESDYEDNTGYKNDAGTVQTSPLTIKALKFTVTGSINIAEQMTTNSGRIKELNRSSIVLILPCGSDSEKPDSFTGYFRSADGEKDCANKNNTRLRTSCDSANGNVSSYITKKNAFGYYLDIADSSFDLSCGRYKAKQALSRAYDLKTAKTQNADCVTAGPTTPANYTPETNLIEIVKTYYGKDVAAEQSAVDTIKATYAANKTKFDTLFNQAIIVSNLPEFKGKISPIALTAWIIIEVGGQNTLNYDLYAENCNDSDIMNVHSNVNRVAHPCRNNSGSLLSWQNTGYQMTNHARDDYKNAINFALQQYGGATLQTLASKVIQSSLSNSSVIRHYDSSNPSGNFGEALQFSSYGILDDFFKAIPASTGELSGASDKVLTQMALVGKDPFVALYINAKTISGIINGGGNLNYGAYYSALPNIIYAIADVTKNFSPTASSSTTCTNSTTTTDNVNLSAITPSDPKAGGATLTTVTSSTYIQLLRNASKANNNIPIALLLAIKARETGSQTDWLTNDALMKAATETQIGPNGIYGELALTTNRSITIPQQLGITNKVNSPVCLRGPNIASNGLVSSVDIGPMQLNFDSTWPSYVKSMSKPVKSDYPNRKMLSNGSIVDLPVNYDGNACDIVDSTYAAAAVADGKRTAFNCGSSWTIDAVYCTLAAYNGGFIASTPFSVTDSAGKTYTGTSAVTPHNETYAKNGLLIYLSYGGK